MHEGGILDIWRSCYLYVKYETTNMQMQQTYVGTLWKSFFS
jgi:hypothetical protein